jgi:hypothetical protein
MSTYYINSSIFALIKFCSEIRGSIICITAEPFFQMGARVEFCPAMNFEELKKGLSSRRL